MKAPLGKKVIGGHRGGIMPRIVAATFGKAIIMFGRTNYARTNILRQIKEFLD